MKNEPGLCPRFFSAMKLDAINPVFALTVHTKTCRRMLVSTAIVYVLAVSAIFGMTFVMPLPENFSQAECFEAGFLLVTCCSIVFLGCDFGSVFIEATFQDELFRLTPLTPLDIVHGGILSSLFFSFLLLCPAFPFLVLAYFVGFPIERAFWAVWLLLVVGQAMNLVLLSYYINAASWRQIGFGAGTVLTIILSLIAFGFTEFGRMLFDDRWPRPMLFLFVVSSALIGTAYFLARNHARSRRRSFSQSVAMNLTAYALFFFLVATIVIR